MAAQVIITVTLANGQDHKHTLTGDEYSEWADQIGMGPLEYLHVALAEQEVFILRNPEAGYNLAHFACVQVDVVDSAEIQEQLRRDTRAIGFRRPSREAARE